MRAIYVGLFLTVPAAFWAADKIQPFNVKTGLWETTINTTMSGGMPIPDSVLARLTPEQRARMEERMKASSGGKTTTATSRGCVTKEDLEKAPKFGLDQKACTYTILNSTGTKAEIRAECDKEGVKGSGTMQVEALSSESVKGSYQSTAISNGHTMNVSSNFTSKWLGATCTKE